MEAPAPLTPTMTAVDSVPPVADASASPPGRSLRKPVTLAAVAVVVGVVVLLAALYVGGVGPFARSTTATNSVTSAQTYAQAADAAGQAAGSFGAGPWKTLFAAGADLPSPLLESTTIPPDLLTSAGLTGCVGTAEGGDVTAVTFPAFAGNLSTGQSPDWLIVMVDGSGTLLFLTVVAGTASVWEKYSGAGCAALALLGTLPASISDSSDAAASFMSSGAGAFIQEHPGGFLAYSASALSGGGGWTLSYSTCPPTGTGSAGSTYYSYNATVSLTGASVVGTPVAGVETCSGLDLTAGLAGLAGAGGSGGGGSTGTPLANVLRLSSLTEGHGASYYYSVTVTSAQPGIKLGNLEFTVLNATGKVPVGPYAVEVYESTGCGLALGALNDPIYFAPLSGGCTSSSTLVDESAAPIAAGLTLSILSTASLVGSGDRFVVLGESPYSGNITATIS